MQSPLTITCETVCSAAYLPEAAKTVYDAIVKLAPDRLTSELEQWAETGGEFPVVWGSGMAVDVPYLLNQMVEQSMHEQHIASMAERIVDNDNDAGHYAFRVSKALRGGQVVSLVLEELE